MWANSPGPVWTIVCYSVVKDLPRPNRTPVSSRRSRLRTEKVQLAAAFQSERRSREAAESTLISPVKSRVRFRLRHRGGNEPGGPGRIRTSNGQLHASWVTARRLHPFGHRPVQRVPPGFKKPGRTSPFSLARHTSPVHLQKVSFATPVPGPCLPEVHGRRRSVFGDQRSTVGVIDRRMVFRPACTRGRSDQKRKKPPGASPGGLLARSDFRKILAAWRSSFAEFRH